MLDKPMICKTIVKCNHTQLTIRIFFFFLNLTKYQTKTINDNRQKCLPTPKLKERIVPNVTRDTIPKW
jgi:hypothetical protein